MLSEQRTVRDEIKQHDPASNFRVMITSGMVRPPIAVPIPYVVLAERSRDDARTEHHHQSSLMRSETASVLQNSCYARSILGLYKFLNCGSTSGAVKSPAR